MSTLPQETDLTKVFHSALTDMFSDETKVKQKVQSALNSLDSVDGQENTRSPAGENVNLAFCSESRLVDIHRPSFKPLTSDSEMPPVPLPSKNSSVGFMEIDNGSADLKEVSNGTSLSTLLSILARWVTRCLEKIPTHPENADLVDLKEYAEKEIVYGLGILNKLDKRVDTLLKSAGGLPDPATTLANGLESQNSSICDRLNSAGLKVKRRLEALKVEGTEDYGSFISVFNDISKQNYDEFYVKELKVMTFSIVINSIVNASENVIMLGLEIKNFRNKIREFCSAFD